MAQIKFWEGMSQATRLDLIDKFMVGVNADGSTKYANLQQLRAIVAASTQAPQAINTSFDFDGASEGIYIPIESGTYDGVSVDLSSGYTQLIWDGANLVDVVFPIDLAGYATSTDLEVESLGIKASLAGKNLFNKDGLINNGAYLNSTTGNPSAPDVNAAYSDYIPVQPETTYTLSGAVSLVPPTSNVVVFYNAAKTQISRVNNVENYTHTTPAGTAFVRFNIRYGVPLANADYTQIQYEEGSSATSYEPFSTDAISGSKVDFNLTPNKSIELSKVAQTEISRNLFSSQIINGFYLSSTNGLPSSTSPTSAYCDYLAVEENTTYTLSGVVSLKPASANCVVFYDAAKTIISWVNNTNNYTHTTPAGTAFVRFNVRFGTPLAEADYSRIQYEKGAVATSFVHSGSVIDASYIQFDNEEEDNVPAPVADIYMIPCYGQSLSINTDAGPSTFTSPVAIAYDTALVNTNIQDMNGGYAEMFLMLSKGLKPLNSNFKMMTCLGGAGGRSVLQLSRGSTYYNTLRNNIMAGKATADAAGLTYNVPAFMWTQGEEDYRTGGVPADYGAGDWNPLEYAEKLKTLIDQINEDVKAITGQKNDVKCIMYQIGSHNAYYRYPRIAMQQLKLAMEDNRVCLAKPMYDVDYNSDQGHAPAKTYRNMGNHYGIALFETVALNKRYLPIFPQQWFVQGNDVVIKFHVPVGPLMIDTVNVTALPDGNYGFALYNVANETVGATGTIAPAAETITSVTIEEGDVVRLTLSAIPSAGTRLTYGVNGGGHLFIGGTGSGSRSGRTEGARGNLRDSQSYKNQVDDYFQLYNWCPIFEIVF